ncbi:MAG: PAS domain S-box protein [Chitinophagaceae bacterium]|nr:MAG: PAS domain S-box protein [Chitinophagaceae bacterium]
MTDLGHSAFDLFHFFGLTPDLVCIASKDGYFRQVNHSVLNCLGYTLEELTAVPISTFIHPDDKEITSRTRFNMLAGQPLTNFQNRYLTKSGAIVWLHWTSIFIPEKNLVFAIAKDVTARKQSEQQVEENVSKFKNLATHFKYSQEKDRKFLANELHEEIAQLASLVRLDLNWINKNTPGLPEASKAKLEHVISASGKLINSIRKLSYSLSPDMLEKLGLDETLRWLSDEFYILHGIPCEYTNNAGIDRLPHDIKLDLFRICQEALSNVLYYADARNVKIEIEQKNDLLCLSISDNGRGLQVEYRGESPATREIKERVASIDGDLSIITRAGEGTIVSISIYAPPA